MERKNATELCQAFDYVFRDLKLLFEALRHTSWFVNKEGSLLKSYQRLEFVGDAVVELLTAEMLYHRFPEATEGELTQFKSLLVNNNRLSVVARKFEVGKYLEISPGGESEGTRDNDHVLACALEAIFGAVFIDSGGGYLQVQKILKQHLFIDADIVLSQQRVFDPKSWLQELAQEKYKSTPIYKVTKNAVHGANHFASVLVNDFVIGCGEGRSAKEAEKRAARNALETTNDLTKVPFGLSKQRDLTSEIGFT